MSDIAEVKNLPRWCIDIISNPPRSGEGFHNWLFRAARALWKCGRTENDIRSFLENAAVGCGRHISDREIDQALKNSQRDAYQFENEYRVQPWSVLNQEKRKEALASGHGVANLWDLSPIRLEDNDAHTEEIIDQLFPGNTLLCAGETSAQFGTRPRADWRGQLSEMQFIVPSPMSAITGITQEGKESEHSLDNTGPRRFLVVEQDNGDPDDQAAVLLHLATKAPFVMAVHSGSKSIHGWFYCAAQREGDWRRFMDYAVSLGADSATWTRSQFVRMPDGLRDNGKRQTVYYFNPELIK